MKKIHGIVYNWAAYDKFEVYNIGKNGVVDIIEHSAIGEGDRWFYDVNFEDGAMHRIYNPNQVYFKPMEDE